MMLMDAPNLIEAPAPAPPAAAAAPVLLRDFADPHGQLQFGWSMPPAMEQAGGAQRVIDPNAVYAKRDLAAIFGVSVRTIERWAGLNNAELERRLALPAHERARCATLPPPFYQGRLPRWRGAAILADLHRKQQGAERSQFTAETQRPQRRLQD